MKDLIENWGKLADKYMERGRAATNFYTAERLFASSETLELCADQLRRKLKEMDDKNG